MIWLTVEHTAGLSQDTWLPDVGGDQDVILQQGGQLVARLGSEEGLDRVPDVDLVLEEA